MNRAGREPAEDAKRRIVAACRQAGLIVLSARMYLRHQENDRVIYVQAAQSGRPDAHASISIMTAVGVSGSWSGELDIRCAAWDRQSEPNMWDIPVMRGRGSVPLEGLVDALKRTVEEQQQVIAAMRMGVDGPYSFGETRWDRPLGAQGI